jgi:tetratricopeptide (TPR) repeat protein
VRILDGFKTEGSMKIVYLLFMTIFCGVGVYPEQGLAESKYNDEEINRILEDMAKRPGWYEYEPILKYAKTQNQEAMELYKTGAYLINVRGEKDKQERMEEGIRRLQAAINLDPSFSAAHVFLGRAYQYSITFRLFGVQDPQDSVAKGLGEKAEAHYRKAVEVDPSNPDGHYRLAYMARNREDRVRHLKKVLELNPEASIADSDRAHIAESEGKVKEAFNFLIQEMGRFIDEQRCYLAKNPPSAEFGFGYFRKKYPKEYKVFEERVCSGKDLPLFQPFGE